MLMRATRHAGGRPGTACHHRFKILWDFIRAIQFVESAARVREHRQRFNAHTRQVRNLENPAHFDMLPAGDHVCADYLKSLHLSEHFSQTWTP